MATLPVPGDSWIGLGIEEQIGDGTSVRVHAAFDPQLDRRVAVKVLDPDGIPPEWAERFVRDARIAGSLDHPRILPVLRTGIHDGIPYVVTPFIDQGDLRDELTRGPLSIDDTTNVVGRIGSALDRVHAAGLVHRNVRPANILRTEFADKVFLTGFGMVGQPLEHPHHASPELIRGESITGGTDIYSLGAILFECLTGRVPYPAESTSEVLDAHLEQPPPTVSALRPDLPVGLDDVIATAMAADPSDRFPTGQAMVDAIMGARAEGAAARPVPVVGVSPVAPAVDAGLPDGAAPAAVDDANELDDAGPAGVDPDAGHPDAGAGSGEDPSSGDVGDAPEPDDDAGTARPLVAARRSAPVAPPPGSVPDSAEPADAAITGPDTPDAGTSAASDAPTRAEPVFGSGADPRPGAAPTDGSTDATDALPVTRVGNERGPGSVRLEDGSVDGEVFGVYEDEESSSRLGAIVATLLVVAILAVGLLTWRAVNTEAEFQPTTSTTTSTSTPPDPEAEPAN